MQDAPYQASNDEAPTLESKQYQENNLVTTLEFKNDEDVKPKEKKCWISDMNKQFRASITNLKTLSNYIKGHNEVMSFSYWVNSYIGFLQAFCDANFSKVYSRYHKIKPRCKICGRLGEVNSLKIGLGFKHLIAKIRKLMTGKDLTTKTIIDINEYGKICELQVRNILTISQNREKLNQLFDKEGMHIVISRKKDKRIAKEWKKERLTSISQAPEYELKRWGYHR